MENTKNEMAVANTNFITESNKNTFTSKVCDTIEEKKSLFNALESCDVLLNDCKGQEILIKDVYIEQKEVRDDESGEIKTKYRTILFDVTGQTYATGSYGIFNSIKKLMQVYGAPTWEDGILVEVAERKINDGKKSLTLLMK